MKTLFSETTNEHKSLVSKDSIIIIITCKRIFQFNPDGATAVLLSKLKTQNSDMPKVGDSLC